MRKTTFAVALVTVAKALKTGIVYRDDINVEEYRPDRDEFAFAFNWPADNPICGASMITPQHMITAGHCLEDGDFRPFQIRLKERTYNVTEARPNPCYDLRTGLPYPADMAILVLEEPIPDAVAGDDYVEVWSAEQQ